MRAAVDPVACGNRGRPPQEAFDVDLAACAGFRQWHAARVKRG